MAGCCQALDLCEKCFGSYEGHAPEEALEKFVRFDGVRDAADEHHCGVLCRGPRCESLNICLLGRRRKCLVCPDYSLCGNCANMSAEELGHDITHEFADAKPSVFGNARTIGFGVALLIYWSVFIYYVIMP